jgi:hypothetical protein
MDALRIPPSHSALVEALIADARPVRRLLPPRARLAAWLALAAVVVPAALALTHVRHDLPQVLRTLPFLLGLVVPLAAAGMAAWLALRLAVPGEDPDRRAVALAVALSPAVVLLPLSLPAGVPASLAAFVTAGWPCLLVTLLMAGLPWVALLVALRRGAPLAPGRAGALAGAAPFLVAAAGTRLVCPIEEALHLGAWHVAPVVVGAGLSALLGVARLGRWERA